MRICVLGPVSLEIGDAAVALTSSRQRRLLLALVLAGPRGLDVEQLVERVWDPADAPRSSVGSLRTYVNRLRRVVGDDERPTPVVATRPGGYRLDRDDVTVDAEEFTDLLAAARQELDPAKRATAVGQALSLWRGPALVEVADRDWAQPEAERLGQLRVEAEELRIEVLGDLGQHAEAATEATRLLDDRPFHDGLRERQVVALYRAGRQRDALRAIEEHRSRLVDELGLDPSPRLAELEHRILDHEETLDPTSTAGRALRGYRLHEVTRTTPRSVVYRATQPGQHRDVAVEVLGPDVAADAGFVRRFDSMAKATRSLDQPGAVRLVDSWREPERAVLVWEWTAGTSLANALWAGPMTPDRAVGLVRAVAGTLDAAARRGVHHGDLGPDHILLDTDGSAFVTGLGFATDPATAGARDRASLGAIARRIIDLDDLRRNGDESGADAAEAVIRAAIGDDPEHSVGSSTEFADRLADALGPGHAGTDGSTARLVRNPFRGLEAFDEPDADVFFGRETLVAEIVGRLSTAQSGLLALVGPSGVGKTSLLNAGVIPALRAAETADWYVAQVGSVPDPLRALCEALAGVATRRVASPDDPTTVVEATVSTLPSTSRLLVVADQLEAVLGDHDDAIVGELLDVLGAAAAEPRVDVLVTLRSGFLDRLLAHPSVGPLLHDGTVPVGPLSPGELARVIREPTRSVGIDVEDRLTDDIVAEVAGEPGSLPLLQFTLTELFRCRESGVLTAAAYESLGGVGGALIARADHVLDDLGVDDVDALRRLLLRLVRVGDGAEPASRPVPENQLLAVEGAGPELLALLDDARLVTFDRDPVTREPVVTIAHDALLTRWPRLHRWIEEASDDLVARDRLSDAAAAWDADGRDPGGLLRGVRLDAASQLRDRGAVALDVRERALLDASLAAAEAERTEIARQLDRERRGNRRLRTAIVATIALLAVAVTAGVLAVRQRTEAERAADSAAVAAVANRALVERNEQPELARLLAAEAYRRDPGPSSQRALLTVLAGSPLLAAPFDDGVHRNPPPTFCPATTDGPGRFLSLGGDNVFLPTEAVLADARGATVERVRSNLWCRAWPGGDGDTLIGRGANTDLVVDRSSGALLTEMDADIEIVGPGPDGTVVGLWPRPTERGTAGPPEAPYDIGYVRVQGPDPAEIVIASATDGSVTRRSGTRAERAIVSPDQSMVFGLDGRTDDGPRASLVDTATFDTVDLGAVGDVAAASWSPDGRAVAAVTTGGDVHLWQRDGTVVAETVGGTAVDARSIAAGSDGRRLAVLGDDAIEVLALDEADAAGFVSVTTADLPGTPVAASWIDETRLAVLARDGTIDVLTVSGRTFETRVPAGDPVAVIGSNYGLDGSTVVSLDDGAPIDDRGAGIDAAAENGLLTALDDGRLVLLDRDQGDVVLIDPFGDAVHRGALFDENAVRDAVGVLAWAAPGDELDVGIVTDDVGRFEAVVRRVDARLEPTAPASTAEMGLAHFWHGSPHLWQITTAPGAIRQWAPDGTSLHPSVPVADDLIRGGVSPDGELAVVIDEQGTGTVVDVTAGSTLGALSRRLDISDPVVFADGRAAVRELDGQIALWSLRDRRRIGPIGRTDAASGTRMVASSTGLWYLTADEFVHVDLRPASWLRAACEQAGRSLTASEWDEYVARGDRIDACATPSD